MSFMITFILNSTRRQPALFTLYIFNHQKLHA